VNGFLRLTSEHWKPAPPLEPATVRCSVDAMTEVAFQESARADAKSAALLTIVGIGFAAFSAGCASAVVAPLRGPAQWLSVGALAGVCAVAELLLLALRPRLGDGRMGERYFAVWRRYAGAADVLAAELSAEPDACRTLIQLSRIVWRKYLLIRWAIDLLLAVVPVIAVAVSAALLLRLDSWLVPSIACSETGTVIGRQMIRTLIEYRRHGQSERRRLTAGGSRTAGTGLSRSTASPRRPARPSSWRRCPGRRCW
jgi:Pycsar effector protein